MSAAAPAPALPGADVRRYQEKLGDMAFAAGLAEERERRRLAADLHERLGQSLALLEIRLSALRDRPPRDPAAARADVDGCVELVEEMIAHTRRLTFQLCPPLLHDLGLQAAVAWLADEIAVRHDVAVSVEGAAGLGLPRDAASVLFRVVRDLLWNVVQHARTKRAIVVLAREGDALSLTVKDSGVGFDPEAVLGPAGLGFGLFAARERVSRLGGSFEVVSAPGEGTRVRLCVPVPPRELLRSPERP